MKPEVWGLTAGGGEKMGRSPKKWEDALINGGLNETTTYNLEDLMENHFWITVED